MRLLVYSDIHANQAALVWLTRAIAKAHTMDADSVYCIGDVVGYGGWPTQTWRWVAENCNNYENLRLGNHDVTAARWVEAAKFGMQRDALFSIALHRAMMRKENPQLLADVERLGGAPNSLPDPEAVNANIAKYQLPIDISTEGYRVVMVHADMCPPTNPDRCSARGEYLTPAAVDHGRLRHAASIAYENYPPPADGLLIIVVGHTHRPMITIVDKLDRVYVESADYCTIHHDAPFDLAAWAQRMQTDHNLSSADIKAMIVNPGSVGSTRDGLGMQPDGTVAAHALHLDLANHQLRFFIEPYNAQTQSQRLNELHLTTYLDEQDWRDLHENLASAYSGPNCISSPPPEPLIPEAAVKRLNLPSLSSRPDGLQTYADVCAFLHQSYRTVAADVPLVYERIWQVVVRQSLTNRLTRARHDIATGKYGYLYTTHGFSKAAEVV